MSTAASSISSESSQLIRVLQQEPLARSAEDEQALLDFLSTVPFFAKMSHAQRCLISRFLQHRVVQPNEVVIREGGVDTEFYVILMGSVSVYRKRRHKSVDTDLAKGRCTKSQRPQRNGKSRASEHGRLVAQLNKGASFGELALLHNEPRTATIVAGVALHNTASTHLAVLEADDYAQLLRDRTIRAAQIEWKVSLLRRAPLLGQLTTIELAHLGYLFDERSFVFGDEVQREGEEASHLFVIVSGECKLLRAAGTPAVQTHRRYSLRRGSLVIDAVKADGVGAGASRNHCNAVVSFPPLPPATDALACTLGPATTTPKAKTNTGTSANATGYGALSVRAQVPMLPVATLTAPSLFGEPELSVASFQKLGAVSFRSSAAPCTATAVVTSPRLRVLCILHKHVFRFVRRRVLLQMLQEARLKAGWRTGYTQYSSCHAEIGPTVDKKCSGAAMGTARAKIVGGRDMGIAMCELAVSLSRAGAVHAHVHARHRSHERVLEPLRQLDTKRRQLQIHGKASKHEELVGKAGFATAIRAGVM